MDLRSLFSSANFTEHNGVYSFSPAPPDIQVSEPSALADRSKWTYWRKRNYEFLRRETAVLGDGAIVLNLGAGVASGFQDFLDRFSAVGVDIYPYVGVRVLCDFRAALPFRSSSADAVIMANLLEHIADPAALLAECYRVLKPGGLVIGTVPFLMAIHQRPYDYYRYTGAALAHLLALQGFIRSRIEPVLSFSELLHLLNIRFFAGLVAGAGPPSRPPAAWWARLLARAVWKGIRAGHRLLAWRALRVEWPDDPDVPLGYHFLAIKPGPAAGR